MLNLKIEIMHSFWEGKCFPCIIIAVTITIILLTVGSVESVGSIKTSKETKNKTKQNDSTKISKNIRSFNKRK